MNKQIYFDTTDNSWKSVRGHNGPGAVWVDSATEPEIQDHLQRLFGQNSKRILDLVGETFEECEAALTGRRLELEPIKKSRADDA